ncbi:MAG: Flp family type IVb pilin [Actinomycetia bacterium]|nr:Flp family type IVb pilin [Actinomycetes bacterium]
MLTKRDCDQLRSRGDDGATMVEYAIMVSLIAAVSIAIIRSIGSKVLDLFTTVTF